MTRANGRNDGRSEAEETAISEIKTLASRIPKSGSVSVLERVKGDDAPFEQKTHALMLESIDKITQQWVGELGHVRDNTHVIEKMVIAQAAKVKDEITKLHLLGVQTMKEAERGHEVTQHLGEQLEVMMGEYGEQREVEQREVAQAN